MTASLGAELRRLRTAAGLSQQAVATELGVQRPTLSQWEADKHKPSTEHLTKLDELYGAQGGLTDRRAARDTSFAEVFRRVSDALVGTLVMRDDGTAAGWRHNLIGANALSKDGAPAGPGESPPTPLSTAYVLRTLQLLDSVARVDAAALVQWIYERRNTTGWSNRSKDGSRPEVTAAVLNTLARLGHVKNVDGELRIIEASLSDFVLMRPYIVAVVLESVLAMRPESLLVKSLTRTLLDSRKAGPQGALWAMNASAEVSRRVLPSLAHTARAVTVLRQVGSDDYRDEVDEAIGQAVEWIAGSGVADDETFESLPSDPANPEMGIPIQHFTASWTIRALAGIDGVPPVRMRSALASLWDSYDDDVRLWGLRAEGTVPSWMTCDAVAALRTYTLNEFLAPPR